MLVRRFATAGMMALAVVAVARAQSPADQPARLTFEVASIKPSDPNGGRGRSNFPLTPGDRYAPNDGYFSVSGRTVANFIAFAYAMDTNPDVQLNTLPAWTRSERYDIEARAKGPSTKDQMRAMVRSLLEDRFKMQMHYETRNIPVYVMTLVKPGQLGPQMRLHVDEGMPCPATDVPPTNDLTLQASAAATAGSNGGPNSGPAAPTANAGGAAPGAATGRGAGGGRGAAGGGGGGGRGGRATPDGYPMLCGDLTGVPGAPEGRTRLGGRDVTMDNFMSTLRGGLDRYAIDQTGLTGRYDWWIEYVQDPNTDGVQIANANRYYDPTGPKLFTAFHDQLGLKLTATKADVKLMIFDHIDRPTPN